MSFSTLHLDPALLKAVKELGFAKPTPIQSDAIPGAIEGRDVLACAMTGSGKTLAFLLPVVHQLLTRKGKGTRVLVLTPTRELAAQILEEFNTIALHTPIRGAAIFGGVGMGPQEHAFRTGVDVLVATPGRLLDHLRHPYASLGHIEHLVLDEADRMLDMGFLPDIRKVLKQLPAKRQTLFFSATMPGPILELTREMLKSPLTINLARKAAPAVGITQAVYPVQQELKSALLLELLNRDLMEQALVFTRTKHRANRLWEFLDKRGVSAARIHGNRSQAQRTQALSGFKDGTFRVLVATDIAARGIDVEALGHVVNFDVPLASEDYIHRVGRTARAELTGEAYTFVSPGEEDDLRAIERAVGKGLPRVTLPDFDYNARTDQKLEVPLKDRLAAHRAQRAKGRDKANPREQRPSREAARSGPSRPAAAPAARADRPDHVAGTPSAPGSASKRRRRRGGRGRGPQGGGPYREA
ncbi:MAG: DEAD/DEAH box helicase [Gemmatimonadetes bacterium]|nr:DEAD/DEAH box helicase [Gemmatimonadota bacterium]